MSNVFAYFLVISNVTSTIDITLIFSLALATMCVCVRTSKKTVLS